MFWNNAKPKTREHLIGELLVEIGVSRKDLDKALSVQDRASLGEILIEMGVATSAQVEAARLEQKVRRGTATRQERSEHRKMLANGLRDDAKASRETTLRRLQTLETKT